MCGALWHANEVWFFRMHTSRPPPGHRVKLVRPKPDRQDHLLWPCLGLWHSNLQEHIIINLWSLLSRGGRAFARWIDEKRGSEIILIYTQSQNTVPKESHGSKQTLEAISVLFTSQLSQAKLLDAYNSLEYCDQIFYCKYVHVQFHCCFNIGSIKAALQSTVAHWKCNCRYFYWANL